MVQTRMFPGVVQSSADNPFRSGSIYLYREFIANLEKAMGRSTVTHLVDDASIVACLLFRIFKLQPQY